MAAAVPYLIVGAVGLIGQWLLGPKSGAQNSTQPSEMPSVNQALRGTPLFINFGQVRVSSQIIWTKNWKAVRQKGGGKGAAKGGGSGGGGSAKGASSGAYGYEYSWDLIFHFGMVDVPCIVSKAWIGSDRVISKTVAGWNGAIGTSGQPVNPFQDNVFRVIFDVVEGTGPLSKGQADMTATEAFYSPGFATGDPSLTAWPYFTAQEGLSPAWPSTCWLGFNQLHLGSTPAVPQLSVELTPNQAAFTVDHTVYPNADNPVGSFGTSARFMKADDKLYQIMQISGVTSNNGATIVDVVAGTEITLSDATGLADVTAINGAGANRMDVFPVPYSPYFYNAFLYDDISNPKMVFVLYKISAGAITKLGSVSYIYTGGSNQVLTFAIGIGRMPNGDVALAYFGRSTNHHSYLTTILGPESIGVEDLSFTAAADHLTYALPFGDNFFGNVLSTSSRPVVQVAFSPDADPTVQTVKVIVYIDRGRVQDELVSGANTYIQTQGATYPNGFMLSWDYPGAGAFGLTDTWRVNTFLIDGSGDAFMPFTDVGLDSTGGTGNLYDDYFIAHTQSGYFVVGRTYSDIPYKTHLMLFTADGEFVGNLITDYSDATEWGAAGSPGLNSNQTLDMNWFIDPDNFSIWFASTRQRSGTGDIIRYVRLGSLSFQADLTPPEIIKKILTSEVYGFATSTLFGFTITADSIDDATYADAVDKCNSEGIRISVSYTNQDSLLSILDDLLALYGGTLAEQNGKIFFDVFRDTDSPIRVIDNDHLLSSDTGVAPVMVTKGAIQDGFNSVQYQYLDRKLDYKRNQITVTDEVDIDLNGYRNKVYPSQFVMTGSLASQAAERALWSNMYGRDNYEFKLGWKDADLRPGNQITLVDSFHPALQRGIKAVINKKQEAERGQFTINATRIFDNHLTAAHGYTNTASVSAGIDDILEAPDAMADFHAYELPQEFQGANGFVYFGYNQKSYVMGAQLYISRDLGANYILTQDVQPFIISGRMASPLPLRAPGYVETDAEFYVLPRDGFSVSSPDFITDYTLDDATAAIRQSGLATIIVGSEAIAMQDLTLVSQNHYRAKKLFRGWGGTPIAAISSGAFFHEHAAGIFAFPITEDDIGNRLFYKIIGYNFAGHAYDIASVAAQEYDVKGLRWLPRCATPIRTFVQSAIAWDASSEFRGSFLAVASGGSDVTLAWADAANNEGFGSGGAGAGTFGHFASDGTIDGWRIDVSSVNGTKVSSFVASTRSFSYSVAQNSADFGGFAKSVVYQVTPFNVKGDGPTTSTRTLSLIW